MQVVQNATISDTDYGPLLMVPLGPPRRQHPLCDVSLGFSPIQSTTARLTFSKGVTEKWRGWPQRL